MTRLFHTLVLRLRQQASTIVKWLSWLTVLTMALTTMLFGFLTLGASDGEALYAFLIVVVPFDVAIFLVLGVAPSGYLYWKHRQAKDRSSLRRSSWAIAIVVAEALALMGAAVFG